jgi:DNA-binding NarL/FixJ family response regulator
MTVSVRGMVLKWAMPSESSTVRSSKATSAGRTGSLPARRVRLEARRQAHELHDGRSQRLRGNRAGVYSGTAEHTALDAAARRPVLRLERRALPGGPDPIAIGFVAEARDVTVDARAVTFGHRRHELGLSHRRNPRIGGTRHPGRCREGVRYSSGSAQPRRRPARMSKRRPAICLMDAVAHETPVLLGRDEERAAIGALLDGARVSKSGAVVVRGEPGIGKTALLVDARERASDMQVLSARGVESESELPYAALDQLLRPALVHVDKLPAPQGRALRSALGLEDGAADERFLVFAGCLSLLSELAEERPVLCLIDDAHWLDEGSSDALLFTARRINAEGIVMLFAAREGDVRRFGASGVQSIMLGGLDAEAAAAVFARGPGGDAAASVRARLTELAAGNALALLELPSALTEAQLGGTEPLPETLPLTQQVESVFLERLRRLSDESQQLLLVAAADDTGSLNVVSRAAAAGGVPADGLIEAEQAGLVTVHGDRLVFRHPLVRSAAYAAATSTDRRAAHASLAVALAGEEYADQCAWHRAAAALGPDAETGAALEKMAERARLRSGNAAAATALERAAELSSDAESKARRLVGAATAAWHAGQPERASALLERADPIVSDLRLRAQLTSVRGEIQFQCGDLLIACETLVSGAAGIAALDPRKALQMLFDAANAGDWAGDYGRVAEAVERAAALPRSGDEGEALLTDMLIGVGSFLEGTSAREVDRVRRVVDRADAFDEPIWLLWAAWGAGAIGDDARAEELLRRSIGLARASGTVNKLTHSLMIVALEGIFAGRCALAAEATEGFKLARDARLRNTASVLLAELAWFAAVKGRDDECGTYAAQVTKEARETRMAIANTIARWGLALVDLARGRPEIAAVQLEELRAAPPGVCQPHIALMFTPDLVEASVRAGFEEQARTACTAFESFAQPEAPTWALALAARCRALLSDDAIDTEREFTEALRLHARSSRPFDRARTELLYGEHLRRQRKRVESREHFRTAFASFDALGAEPWAERARAELRASGETARKRDPSTIDQLTPHELQIVRFVAEGLSNKEVAAQLFLSPRTIDHHLRNVFAKLGITSRTQLAHLLGDDAAAPAQGAVAHV